MCLDLLEMSNNQYWLTCRRGVYSLTEHGMRFLTACHQQGFHTHPSEPPLYKVNLTFNITSSIHILYMGGNGIMSLFLAGGKPCGV